MPITNVKVQLKEIKPMTKQGIDNWGRKLKHRVYKNTFNAKRPEWVDVRNINTQEKIIDYVYHKGGSGLWDFCMPRKRSNKYKTSYITLARVKLIPSDNDKGYIVISFQDTFKKYHKKRPFNYLCRVGWYLG